MKPDFTSGVECSIENVAFAGGEELIYKAYYNWAFIWIPAGEAIFKVVEDDNYYEISVVGSSYKSYDGFFKLRDKFYSKISKKSMLPEVFERTVNEGDYKKYERIEFNQDDFSAKTFIGETKKDAVENQFEFSNCMHDLLSLMYFMRNINVEPYKSGDFIPTSIFFDKEVFPVKVRYEGKEKGKSIKGKGSFNAIKVVPDLIAGSVFNEGDKMSVWVTDDYNIAEPDHVERACVSDSLQALIDQPGPTQAEAVHVRQPGAQAGDHARAVGIPGRLARHDQQLRGASGSACCLGFHRLVRSE